MDDSADKNTFARRLFNEIADSYDKPARTLSLFQYGRWHRFLVSRLDLPPRAAVLDVCTGTGLVAAQISRRYGSEVVGLDLSGRMIARARRNLGAATCPPYVRLVGAARRLCPLRTTPSTRSCSPSF